MLFNYARFANVSILNIVYCMYHGNRNNGMGSYIFSLIRFDSIRFDLILRFAFLLLSSNIYLLFIIIIITLLYIQRLAAPAVFGSTLALYSLQDVHAKEATVDMNKVRDAIMKVVEDDAEKRDDGTSM
jgi:hypothetical protein